ncbi:MAG: carbamoyl-phosphate synthase small subunit, partial [Belnapia sp.]|nr:carbamoyl-phosphate synthase small subunit [Belnapia sp.]
MRTVEDIIALLGGPEAAAARCGIGTEAVRKWRQARAIPPRHWPAILTATGLGLNDIPGAAPEGSPAIRAETTMPQPDPTAAAQPHGHAQDRAPDGATACLVLGDGSVHWGRGFGAFTPAGAAPVAELCFNTGLTGYQETLTDLSYAGQIITFTFPQIGIVGANAEDIEATTPAARGLVVKQDLTEPANYRATRHLNDWLL